MRSINSSKLTKDYILSKVSQITIFATYLGISDKIIQYCIDSGELICSPLRDDKHPTAGFRYNNKGKLKFRDFGNDLYWGDAFDIVATVMNAMYNKVYDIKNKEDFIKVLRHITFTFKDIFYGEDKDINMINEINNAIVKIKRKKPIIELVTRDWNEKDINYWKQFGIDIRWLNINFVYPIDQYYIDRKVNPYPKYFYDRKDPCYAYMLGKDRNGIYNIKLYFPNRKHDYTRFITNCNHLEGIYNLDRNDYDIIVITKSTKDRLAIGAAINRMQSLYGGDTTNSTDFNVNIGCINIPHETYKLRQNEYDWLKSKLKTNGNIVCLMDNDRTGIRETIWIKNNYDIIPILIPKDKYTAKDFAELVQTVSNKDLKDIIYATITYVKNKGEDNRIKRSSSEWCSSIPF